MKHIVLAAAIILFPASVSAQTTDGFQANLDAGSATVMQVMASWRAQLMEDQRMIAELRKQLEEAKKTPPSK